MCKLSARPSLPASKIGRKIRVWVQVLATLAKARGEQSDPSWRAHYRATRPKVKRKTGHLMRRRHDGRRARMRGTLRIGADFSLLFLASSLARLATIGICSTHGGGWIVAG
jgi:hypothetical protein